MKSKAQAIEQNTDKINELRDSSSSSSQDYREALLSRGATIHRFSTSSCLELKHQKKSKNKTKTEEKNLIKQIRYSYSSGFPLSHNNRPKTK